MRLLVTRPGNDAKEFIERLNDSGHQAVHEPLLDIKFFDNPEIADAAYQAVLITSANGARALAACKVMEDLATVPAITVGKASSCAAKLAGFGTIIAAVPGNVNGLVNYVLEHFEPNGGALLYASGAVTTGDLQNTLEKNGFSVNRVVLYMAKPTDQLGRQTLAMLRNGEIDAVTLFSPRTAKIWLEVIANAEGGCDLSQVKHFCLSENVAKVIERGLENNGGIIVCKTPDTDSMLEAVNSL